MANAATGILFIEFPELHIHLDPFLDLVYILGSFHFRLYFFFCCDFAIPLYMAHPFPPLPTAAAPAAPVAPAPAVASLASPPQQVSSISLSEEEDSFEATSSSFSLSSAPDYGYAPTDASIANEFLSSESI